MVMIKVRNYVAAALLLILLTGFLLFLAVKLQGPEALDLSIDKQNILFWGIVVILIQIVILFGLILRHEKILKELEKIAELKELDQPHVQKILKRMGSVGSALYSLLKELNELLALRTYRIQSLNQVLKILCEDSPNAILVSDAMGSVLGQSRKMKEKLASHPKGQSDNIKDFFPAMNLAEVLNAMEKTRGPWDDREGTGLYCTPVFDRTSSLQLCIWDAEGESLIQKIASYPLSQGKGRKGLGMVFKGFGRKRGKGSKSS